MLDTPAIDDRILFHPQYPPGRNVEPRDTPPPKIAILAYTLAVVPKLIRNPLEAYAKFHFDIPISRHKIFLKNYALINDPQLIRHVFVEHASDLTAEPIRQTILRPALRDGLLTAEGEKWRNARHTIAPVFAPRHLSNFSESMRTVANEFSNTLAAGPKNISVGETMAQITYQILSETLFSGEISGNSEAFLQDTAYFIKHMANPDPFDLMSAPEWLPRPTKLLGKRAVTRLRSAVNSTARDRRSAIESGSDVPSDFLTLLLEANSGDAGHLSLDDIEDNILTFIAAGHETTAKALGWTLYLLSKDPHAREKAEAEVDALDMENTPPEKWGEQLPWITASFEEAMRLFPPAGMIIRQLNADIDYEGVDIAAGTTVYISPWTLHRHNLLWDNPSAFDPNRFYGDNRNKIDRFAYLPFGLGPRVCIGARFAIMEMQIVLATLLRNFRFDYSGKKEPWPVMKITIQPDNDMPMSVSPR